MPKHNASEFRLVAIPSAMSDAMAENTGYNVERRIFGRVAGYPTPGHTAPCSRLYAGVLGAALIAGSLSGCIGMNPNWSRTEQWTFNIGGTCHIVDLIQTKWTLDHGGREGNPLIVKTLGSHPTDMELLGLAWLSTEGKALAADYVPILKDYKTEFFALTAAACLAQVVSNKRNGNSPAGRTDK